MSPRRARRTTSLGRPRRPARRPRLPLLPVGLRPQEPAHGPGHGRCRAPSTTPAPTSRCPLTELEEALLLVAGTGLTGLNLGDIDPVDGRRRRWCSGPRAPGRARARTTAPSSSSPTTTGSTSCDMWNLVPEAGRDRDPARASRSRPRSTGSSTWSARAKVQLVARRAPDADRPAGPVRLQPLERQQAGHDALPAGLQHDARVHQPAVHLLLARATASRWWTRPTATRPAGLQSAGSTPAASTPPARWGSSSSSSGCCRCRSSSRPSSARTSTWPCRRWAWAAGPTPATSPASRSGGMDVPGLGFRFAEAKRGPSVPVGRDGVFEAFVAALPRRHGRGGRRLPGGQVVRSTSPTSPSPTSSPTRSSRRSPRPHEDTIEIVKDYCQYVHETYGRFPAYLDPMYQRLTVPGPARRPGLLRALLPAGRAHRAAPRALRALAPRAGRRRRPPAARRGRPGPRGQRRRAVPPGA